MHARAQQSSNWPREQLTQSGAQSGAPEGRPGRCYMNISARKCASCITIASELLRRCTLRARKVCCCCCCCRWAAAKLQMASCELEANSRVAQQHSNFARSMFAIESSRVSSPLLLALPPPPPLLPVKLMMIAAAGRFRPDGGVVLRRLSRFNHFGCASDPAYRRAGRLN